MDSGDHLGRRVGLALVVLLAGCSLTQSLDDLKAGTEGAADAASSGGAGSGAGGTGAATWGGGGASTGGTGGTAGSDAGGTAGTIGDSGVGGSNSCPAGHLPFADDFSDGAFDPEWSVLPAPGVTIAEELGVARFVFGSSVPSGSYAELRTKHAYDLMNCSVLVHLVATPGGPDKYVMLGLYLDSNNHVELDVSNGNLNALAFTAGLWSTLGSVPFDATKHAWLRLRGANGKLWWDFSADGISWQSLTSWAPPYALTALTVALGAGVQKATAGNTDARFDDVDLPPTP